MRSDIFAFGAVLYEMLTGKRAFERKSSSDIIIAVAREEPTPLRELVKNVPEELKRIVKRCLRKQPEDRYASIAEVERELEECRALTSGPMSGINLQVLLRQSKRPRVAIPLLVLIVCLSSLLAGWLHHQSRVRWAREEALPEISQLIDQDKTGEAYALAVQAEQYIPHDPALVKLLPDISWSTSVTTTPSGAAVYRKDYDAPDSAWVLVGHSPIKNTCVRLRSNSVLRFERTGFATVEQAYFAQEMDPRVSIEVTMQEEAKNPPGMVFVDLGFTGLTGRPLRIEQVSTTAAFSAHILLDRQVRGHQPSVQAIRRPGRLPQTRILETNIREGRKDSFLGPGDGLVSRFNRETRSRRVGAKRIPTWPG